MSYFVVDVESDGPLPGMHSMVCFGAVVVRGDLSESFYGKTAPISENYKPDALAVSGFSRQDHENFPAVHIAIHEFKDWIQRVNHGGSPILITDNPAYDFAFINYYMHIYTGGNPFGWSARRIGDIYCGMKMDARAKWKSLRKTRHTHHPVDDARGNAEALIAMQSMGLKIKFE